MGEGGEERVVSERVRWGMPEMKIGFFCDVAASFFMPRFFDRSIAYFLALTGKIIDKNDLFCCSSFPTSFCHSSLLPSLFVICF